MEDDREADNETLVQMYGNQNINQYINSVEIVLNW